MSVERTSGATMKGKTLLPGHTLEYEGRRFSENGSVIVADPNPAGPGRGKCSCGDYSERLPTRAARKRWHREHKDEIRGQNVHPVKGDE